jgi:hypothetical protein
LKENPEYKEATAKRTKETILIIKINILRTVNNIMQITKKSFYNIPMIKKG